MARGLNKVLIIGHLGQDPEMRFTASGRPVAAFNVATSRRWTDNDGERQEETEWFHVVAWGGLAELCKKRLHKGSQVYVEGRLQTRSWEGPEGQRFYRTELVAQEMVFLDSFEEPVGPDEERESLYDGSEEFLSTVS
ncbi:MAG: single-stranded DNA-binding protein [Anaerolineae bacterium]|nr:single-stranded DNA-binding protein [Anaerolineae bacterium]HXK42990.1 single-stranded DNA-binding protein [Anaerolineae bacterium]